MSIGATLAAARRRAGMTVADVSRAARVTEPVIQAVEEDDYAECGGDFYARGHIRTIARAVGEDPAPLIDEFDSMWRSEQEITAAEAFRPATAPATGERRRVRWTAVLAALVLAAFGFASYKLVADTRSPAGPAAAAEPGLPLSARGTRAASPAAGQELAPASVEAFGPGGRADGDNPQLARLAVAGNPATPWRSQVYATGRFGHVKSGTGLLLDMGRAVSVTAVRLSLSPRSGAGLQLRAGRRPVPSGLARIAAASDAGGAVRLSPAAPAPARYLLVWFTELPRDPAGGYQASVYQITVLGRG